MSDLRCGQTVGSKPWYFNKDQWDAVACGCWLPVGHEAPHECEHIREERRIVGPVPSHDELSDDWNAVVESARAEME